MDFSAPATPPVSDALWPDGPPRLYLDRASVNAAEILSELPVDFVESASAADLLWIRENAHDWYDALGAGQALNHIPGERSMIRKADLAGHLHRYGASHPQPPFTHADFFQPTYRLSDPGDTAAFVSRLPATDRPDNLWILKPSTLSMGRGVKIVWRFDWLRKELRKHGEITFRYEGKTLEYVIQRYIRNVLLLDGRKSEIRIYWLIACVDPLLVLMYPEGSARLTMQPYRLGDFSNPLIHITNAYQQKKHGGDRPDVVLKWDFQRLQDHLAEEHGTAADFLDASLRPRLRESLAYVVRASIESLRSTPSPGYFFGLYGADFILDDALTPWLTEVQKGPGLSHDDPVKQRMLPAMLQGAVSIALELLALKRTGRPLSGLSSTYGYEWVIRDH